MEQAELVERMVFIVWGQNRLLTATANWWYADLVHRMVSGSTMDAHYLTQAGYETLLSIAAY